MSQFEKGWTKVEKFIVGLLAFCATLIAFYGVLSRYLLRKPPDWAEEVVIYLIIWAVFISASILAEEKGHVAATLLVERFSLKTRRFLAVFNGVIALAFCTGVTILGLKIVAAAYWNDERSLTGLRFPVWIPYLSVATGCTLVALRYAIRVYRLVFSFQPSEIMETHELSRQEHNE
ncbi:MAG TPA: TRAP transporter small permease [Thermodesulfobacteriota bacterium]|nr:TRAP transporter small permease [Thermodesulfobacteriota bacterium]